MTKDDSYYEVLAKVNAIMTERFRIQFLEALSWGMTYGPTLVESGQWREKSAKMADKFTNMAIYGTEEAPDDSTKPY